MIIVISGVPGTGKTLFALDYVLENFSDRSIYYNHIDGLKLPWTEFEDAKKWFDLPEGSVIVIDEAHQVFEKTDGKSTPPRHISLLDEHRHHGYDIVLITQHPQDLNTYVRNRMGKFLLLERPVHQPEKCTVYEWPRYESHFHIPDVRQKASSYTFNYPKKLYDQYKSATLHTVKRELPKGIKRLIATAALCALALPFVGYAIFHKVSQARNPAPIISSEVNQDDYNPRQKRSYVQEGNDRRITETTTGPEYFANYVPRIQGVPSTAPAFDALTQPRTFPTLQCIASEKKCWCYTQQATRTDTPEGLCREIVNYGYFDVTRSSSL